MMKIIIKLSKKNKYLNLSKKEKISKKKEWLNIIINSYYN